MGFPGKFFYTGVCTFLFEKNRKKFVVNYKFFW